MNSLTQFLDSQPSSPLPTELPFVHSSRCEFLKTIEQDGNLKPRLCNVFDEVLLYLFYGRPAYKTKPMQTFNIGYCPICFVIKPSASSVRIVRAYGLDSGGTKQNRFTPHVAPTDLDELSLGSNIDSYRSHVQTIYGSNKKYIRGNSIDPAMFRLATGSIVKRYLQLLKDPNITLADDRRSAIEVQTDSSIDLQTDLEAVVLPDEFLDEDATLETIVNTWNAQPIGYPACEGNCPSGYAYVIRDRIYQYYEQKALI